MKNALLLLLAVFFSVAASAQRVYFLYLQSDDQSPFYVRMGDKIHSSATSGFLILPNLTDSTYTFGLGFARSTTPESKFSVTINQDDKGFIIKHFEEGLTLFDFRNLSVVKSATAQNDNTVYQTKTDNFSNVLSKAAGDPKLLGPVVKKEEPAKEIVTEKEIAAVKNDEKKEAEKTVSNPTTEQPVAEPAKQVEVKESTVTGGADKPASTPVTQPNADTMTATSQPVLEKKATEQPVVIAEQSIYKPSVVSRYSESSTTEGFGLVFFDRTSVGTDTIRILIPSSKVKLVSETSTQTSPEIKPELEKLDLPKEELKEVSIAPIDSSPSKQKDETLCKNLASEGDFMKLRKKMAAEESDEEMIDEAKKEFRSRCFSVEQIRYLSTLFLTSAAKYQFFDAAFRHVSDRGNFSSLSSEIKDEYYSKRFKALIGE